MIVYLDQNKWIELGKIYHKKDKSLRGLKLLSEFDAARESGAIFPISSVHYVENARISNDGRRSRLGEVMWHYSNGKTIVSHRELIRYEIEVALSEFFNSIKPRKVDLIGRGISHAFGVPIEINGPSFLQDLFESTLLAGSEFLNLPPPKGLSGDAKRSFLGHLNEIQERKNKIEKSKWNDWLHAISLIDILHPLNEVISLHEIPSSEAEVLFRDREMMTRLINSMPTRRLDIHLHSQVLRNTNYKATENDLEDWAGIGVASCYCDVVVCEKHFADMLRRDSYQPKARIETDLSSVFVSLA